MQPNHGNHEGSSDRKKIKINMYSPHNNKGLELNDDIVQKAINKSYTKQLAGNNDLLNVSEIIDNVASYALKFLLSPIDIEKQMQEEWCIVALNQDILERSISSPISSNSYNFKQNVNKQQLKLYQLFIGLGKKQFRFQSLQSYKKKFVINVDVVECIYVPTDPNYSKQDVNRTRFLVDNKYVVDFFINKSALPYRANDYYDPSALDDLLGKIHKKFDNIIGQSISDSKAKKYIISSKQLSEEEFYKTRYATQQQFTKFCQTGDILLFRDNHTFAKVQRFFTNSECDHVGMVYKDQKYGLCIFQSNSSTGVSLAMWNQLIRYKWFQNIEGIYWRRLNVQVKSPNFNQKIKQFVKVNLHKQYGISIGKLLRFKEIVYDTPQQQKNRTFFCSQLIAALYKYQGLLEPNKPASTYIPKDFTDKGSINMINNSALEAERRIIFNQDILRENYKFYK